MSRAAAVASLLLLILLVAPAVAVEELRFEDAQIINVEAPENRVISSLGCADIPGGGEVSLNLNAYGQMYLLTVKESGEWGWWNFNVTCTYPNGTTVSKELSACRPFARDYDLTIQPYWIGGINSMYFDVDVNVGLSPLTVTFQDAYNPTKVQAIAFSQVSGSFSQPTDVVVFLASQKEWEDQKSNNPVAPIVEGISDFFAWTWDQLLTWIAKIPGVGPLFASCLEITVTIISEVIWWFYIAIQYRNLLILLVEFWIISDAITNTKGLFGMLRRIVQNHIKIATGIIWLTEKSVGLILAIIRTVADAVNAIKPI